ncbi:hypothetical protein BJ165DRAFT_1531834 [Panaeolus papilionaceus]|nr:hypothetical protein BJ165DRAFT_1531834 [Panaeolus papilionaceus]
MSPSSSLPLEFQSTSTGLGLTPNDGYAAPSRVTKNFSVLTVLSVTTQIDTTSGPAALRSGHRTPSQMVVIGITATFTAVATVAIGFFVLWLRKKRMRAQEIRMSENAPDMFPYVDGASSSIWAPLMTAPLAKSKNTPLAEMLSVTRDQALDQSRTPSAPFSNQAPPAYSDIIRVGEGHQIAPRPRGYDKEQDT